MGIDRETNILLLGEANKRPFSGSILQLGRQDILLSNKALKTMSGRINNHKFSGNLDKKFGYISDIDYFKYIGFSEVSSLDNSDFEGADFIFDMNSNDLPHELKNRFDVIFDGGTMEHVFNTPQFLKNTFDMLRVGGRIIHFSPIFNHINHGFYGFSPTFFTDYYLANKYIFQDVFIVKRNSRSAYVCDCLNDKTNLIINKLKPFNGAYYTFAIVSKTELSSSCVIPQQGSYLSIWNGTQSTSKMKNIYRSLISKKRPVLYSIMVFLRNQFFNSWCYDRYINSCVKWRRI